MSNIPFWLKIRKEYIFDNFENMIDYLRNETYDKSTPSVNVDDTLKCIIEIISDINSTLNTTPFYNRISLENQSDETIICLMGAAILALHKKGDASHDIFKTLIRYLLSTVSNIPNVTLSSLWNIILSCTKREAITKPGFGWNDISQPDKFKTQVFIHKLSQTEFIHDNTDTWLYENKGFMMVENTNVKFAADTFEDFSKLKSELFNIGKDISIISKSNSKISSNFESLLEESKYFLSSLSQILPPPIKRLNDYGPEDEFIVRITLKDGNLIVAETIDHRYARLNGKLCVKWDNGQRPNPNTIRNFIKLNDLVKVKLSSDPEFKFEMESTLEKYYREFIKTFANGYDYAIPVANIPIGMLCVSQYGVRVVVHSDSIKSLSQQQKDQIQDAINSKTQLPIKYFFKPPVVSKPQFNLYATFDIPNYTEEENEHHNEMADYNEIEEEDPFSFSLEDADSKFAEEFIKSTTEEGNQLMEIIDNTPNEIDPDSINALAHLLFYSARKSEAAPQQQLKQLVTTGIALHLCERADDFKYITYRIKLLSRLIDFCHNREVRPVTSQQQFDNLSEITHTEQIISELASYKNPALQGDLMTTRSPRSVDHDNSAESLTTLITASNNLLSVIDVNELNNIKKAIARSLNLLDEFEPITSKRTFYGVEGISLEFKSSIVFPPINFYEESINPTCTPNPDLQKWAILKTVCGFLNSRSGGELILGVNDNGYATGIDDDIQTLKDLHKIPQANIDQYRIYVQNIIDFAFKEYGAQTLPTDIVALNVNYIPEMNDDGKSLLRLQIRPYPYGIVGFVDSKRPSGYADSYIRRDGRTIPLTPQLREEIEKIKIESISAQSKSITDIIKISKAIDQHRIVILHYNNIPARKIEVYKVWKNRRILYGYDVKERKSQLFYLSHIEDIEVTDKRWSSTHANQDIDIDDFGKLLDKKHAEAISLLLTDYGYQSLLEIAPMVKVKKAPSSGCFSWQYDCLISSFEGISCFCMGFPEDVTITKGEALKKHINELASQILKDELI